MKNEKTIYLVCALFFVVFAAITFRCVIPENQVFEASDLNIGRLAGVKNGLPGAFSGGFYTGPVLGGSGISSPRVFSIIQSVMPLELFANTIYGFILVLGSLSMVWFLRLWGRSWTASIVGALVGFWFNSVILASSGHAYKMEVLAFCMLSLCLIEKAVRSPSNQRAFGYSLLAALSVGIMMIEQQDVALLAGLFIAPYTLLRIIQLHRKNGLRWVLILGPVIVVSLLLSGGTVLSSYKRNIQGAASVQQEDGSQGGNEKWNYITQWSMVPHEWPDLIAPGWGGLSTGNPEGPYWGKVGRSAEWETTKQGFRNFKLDSIYMGIIPFLLGAYGLSRVFKKRNQEGWVIVFWSVAGLVGLVLAFGKYSLLYKLFYQLPLVSNIRAPIKLLDNVQLCLAIVAAFGLDELLRAGKDARSLKQFWIICSGLFGLMIVAGLKPMMFPDSISESLTADGLGPYAEIILENISGAWFHAAILTLLCGILIFVVWKGFLKIERVLPVFILMLAMDSLMLTSKYFKSMDLSVIKRGNALFDYLKDNQGNDRTFLVDQQGIYNQWMALDGPYHKIRFFNIWQMPRMPVEYKKYLGEVGRNQIRLWQLSAVTHVAAPAQILKQFEQNPELGKQFAPVLNYQVSTAQGMRPDVLLEFKGAVPRFALYSHWESISLEEHCSRLIASGHNPRSTLLVLPEEGFSSNPGQTEFRAMQGEISQKSAVISVDTAAPSVLRFAQRYEPTWRVYVDGKKADLLRVDYLSMGVAVPAGMHRVEFRCVNGTRRLSFTAGIFIFSIAGSFVCLKKKGSQE